MKVSLKELVNGLKGVEVYGDKRVKISGITLNSKKVRGGYLFAALKGEKRDGLEFVGDALRKGASSILTHTTPFLPLKRIAWLYSRNERKTLAEITKRFYQNLDEEFFICGITGTNGKTTTAYILYELFERAGEDSGLFSTIEYKWKSERLRAKLTTPEITDIFSMLYRMKKDGVKNLFMEVSSHSLVNYRVYGIDFNCAVFTNLSGDHLDFHKSIENYYEAKKILFSVVEKKGFSFINIDNEYGARLFSEVAGKKYSYSVEKEANFYIKSYKLSIDGTSALVSTPYGELKIKTNLLGKPNLYNLLSAISVALVYGIPLEVIEKVIENTEFKIPGRLEKIMYKGAYIFIDYAHSDDSLRNVLLNLKEFKEGRLIVVFGAGGDRDKTKRPRMGRVATEIADFAIITNDNPRTEHPQSIIEDIVGGIYKSNYEIIEDRRKAIKTALKALKEGDILLIAGKGHEDYQIIGEKVYHFSDREVVEELIDEDKS